jgi:hypothetical protein
LVVAAAILIAGPALTALFAHFAALGALLARALARFAAFAFAIGPIAVAPAAPATELAFAALELLRLLALREFDIRLLRRRVGGGLALLGSFGFRRGFFVAFEIPLVGEAIRRRLHRHRGLHGAHEAEVVICVLQVILAQHAIAGARGVARQLQVSFVNVRSRATDLYLRAIALQRAIGLVMIVVPAARFAAAASLTLH